MSLHLPPALVNELVTDGLRAKVSAALSGRDREFLGAHARTYADHITFSSRARQLRFQADMVEHTYTAGMGDGRDAVVGTIKGTLTPLLPAERERARKILDAAATLKASAKAPQRWDNLHINKQEVHIDGETDAKATLGKGALTFWGTLGNRSVSGEVHPTSGKFWWSETGLANSAGAQRGQIRP